MLAALLLVSTASSFGQRGADEFSTVVVRKHLHILEQVLTGSLNEEAGRCKKAKHAGCRLDELLPYNASLRAIGRDWPPFGFTMVGHARLANVRMVMEAVIRDNIPGSFKEMGVWRGGVCIYAKAIIDLLSPSRPRDVHLFDIFAPMRQYGGTEHTNFLAVREETVRRNFRKFNVLDERVHFHKGLFKHSIPGFSRASKDPIAVLCIDGNFYDSYQDAMYYLYERVPVGGYIIWDDILTHKKVKRFWADFKREQGLPEEMVRIDSDASYFRKTKDIKVDWKHFRAPQDANK